MTELAKQCAMTFKPRSLVLWTWPWGWVTLTFMKLEPSFTFGRPWFWFFRIWKMCASLVRGWTWACVILCECQWTKTQVHSYKKTGGWWWRQSGVLSLNTLKDPDPVLPIRKNKNYPWGEHWVLHVILCYVKSSVFVTWKTPLTLWLSCTLLVLYFLSCTLYSVVSWKTTIIYLKREKKIEHKVVFFIIKIPVFPWALSSQSLKNGNPF